MQPPYAKSTRLYLPPFHLKTLSVADGSNASRSTCARRAQQAVGHGSATKSLNPWLRKGSVLDNVHEPRPECFHARFALVRRDRKHLVHLVLPLQRGQRLRQRIVREPVRLCPHYQERPLRLLEEIDENLIAGLRRNVGVHQADRQRQRLPFGQVRLAE